MFELTETTPAAQLAAASPSASRHRHQGRDAGQTPRAKGGRLRAVLAAGVLVGSAFLVPGLSGGHPGIAHADSGFVYTNPGLNLVMDQNTGSVLLATTQFVPSVNVVGAPNPTVDWGDGTVDTIAPSSCSPNGVEINCTLTDSHVYLQPGSFTITTTYYTGFAISYTTTTLATVNAQTAVFPITYNFSPTEGNLYSGNVANFADSNTADQASAFGATINWGDGTITSGTITGAQAYFGVNGTHSYAEGGTYPVDVKIYYGSSLVDVYSTAFVADAPLSAIGASILATAGTPFSGPIANFIDAGPSPAANQYQVSIDWGDGTPLDTTGTLVAIPGGATAPAQPKSAPTQTTTAPASPQQQATPMPAATTVPVPGGAQGPAMQSPTPQPAEAPAPAQRQPTPVSQPAAPAPRPGTSSIGNAFTVNGSHNYISAGTYTITVKITDQGGSTIATTGTATVQAQPAATSTPVVPVSTPPSTATPTATTTPTPTQPATPATGNGQVIVLDAGANDCTLLIQGGSVSATGVAVNGSSPNATCLNGGTLTAQTLALQGGFRNQGGSIQAGAIPTGQQTADPFAGLTPPSQPSATCPGSACPDGTNFVSGQTYRLLPGFYNQWMNFNSGSLICLAPGTYYLDGGWNVNSDLLPYGNKGCPALPAGVSDPGVTLYFHTGSLQLNNGANVSNLSAPQSGPYSGLLYWQAGSDGLYPNAKATINGTWYAPNAQLTLNSGASWAANQVIVKDLTVNNGASLTAPAGMTISYSTIPN